MIKMSQLASRERDRLFTSWRDVRTGRITYRYTQHHTEYIQSSFQKQLMSFASSFFYLALRVALRLLACAASTLVAAHKRCAKLKINFSGFFFLLMEENKIRCDYCSSLKILQQFKLVSYLPTFLYSIGTRIKLLKYLRQQEVEALNPSPSRTFSACARFSA